MAVSILLTACADHSDNQNVVFEDMEAAFEQADLLSSNIGLFSKTVSGDAISYGECGGAAINEQMQLIGITPGGYFSADGSAVEYNLAEGQKLVVNTGYVAMMDATCSMDIQTVKGVKNVLFGGEGLFNTVVTGPGRVVLQTMPIYSFASQIARLLPSSNS